MVKKIRSIAANWLEQKEVDCFIGYTKKEDGTFSPICIQHSIEAGKLDFGDGCHHNLMRYFDTSKNVKTGMLLKGCDGRALVQLVSEGRIRRESVKVLGVACSGKDHNGTSMEKCRDCYCNTPPIFDEMAESGGTVPKQKPPSYEEIHRIQALPDIQRAGYFMGEFSRCIRCYACREVCPLCYCEECIAEKNDPQWVEVSVKPSSNYYWNMIRAYHLAGRCVGCGECSRVCPGKIPLYLLHQKMAMEVKQEWGYVAGMDMGTKLLDLDFKGDIQKSRPVGKEKDDELEN